ncbi:Eukaryotic translation initiation factor 2 subunit beta, partial [Phytophthora palmivora]
MADVAEKQELPPTGDAVAPPAVPEDVAAMFDLKKKKKKSKKVKKEKKDKSEDAVAADAAPDANSVLVQDPATYSYKDELLARIMAKLHENNPELTDR